MEEKEEVLVCEGYGFLGEKLEILCLSGNKLFSVNLKDASPTDVLISWSYSLKTTMEILYFSNKFEILDVSVNQDSPHSYYEPCPLKLYKNISTGEYRLEI